MKKLLTLSLFLLASNFLMLKGQEIDLQDFDGPQRLRPFEIQNDPFLNKDESDLDSDEDDFISSSASLFLQEPKDVDHYEQWKQEEQTRQDEQEKENVFLQIYDDFLKERAESYDDLLKERAESEKTQNAKNAIKALFSHGAHQVNQLQQLNISKQNNAVKKPRKKQDGPSVLIPKVVKDKSLYNKPTPVTMYRCPRCLSEETFNKKDIDKHLDSCGLPFKCTLCGSGYLQNGGLRKHLTSKSHGLSTEEAFRLTKDL